MRNNPTTGKVWVTTGATLIKPGAMALSLLAFVACAGNVAQGPNPSQQIAALEQRLLESEKRAIVGKIESSRLRRRVHDLEEELARVRREAPQQGTPTLSQQPPRQLTQAQQPTQRQRPRLPEDPIDTEALPPDIQVEDLEEPLDETPAATPSTTAPPPAVPPPTASEGEASASSQPDDQTFAAYDTAYVLFHEERYQQAETSFQDFVERYPDSDLADNAQFWIGECRYALGDFQGALEAFSATVANYPKGNKVPDALLKAGKCLQAMGRKDQARQTYLEVQRRFPDTAIALAAKERLAELD